MMEEEIGKEETADNKETIIKEREIQNMRERKNLKEDKTNSMTEIIGITTIESMIRNLSITNSIDRLINNQMKKSFMIDSLLPNLQISHSRTTEWLD